MTIKDQLRSRHDRGHEGEGHHDPAHAADGPRRHRRGRGRRRHPRRARRRPGPGGAGVGGQEAGRGRRRLRLAAAATSRPPPSGPRARSSPGYLPAALGADELDALVAEEVARAAADGQTGPKAMGGVIKAVRARAGATADGGAIAAAVKAALAG